MKPVRYYFGIWKMFFNDPADKFQTLDSLPFLEPLDTFFVNKKRGGAENSGGSKIIFPDFTESPYSGVLNSNKGASSSSSSQSKLCYLPQNRFSSVTRRRF